MHRHLDGVARRVLKGARPRRGERVLDVGAGTGLLTFPARKRVTASGAVVALDVSHDVLLECRRLAEDSLDLAQLQFVAGDALALPFTDSTFDVVMTRSVLIYLEDKAAGARELYRVLKPGGRASIFEPINEASTREAERREASGFFDPLQPEYGLIREYSDKNKQAWYGTLVGWDERDLCDWFRGAGFSELAMTYEFVVVAPDSKKATKSEIAQRIHVRPNPNMPSYEEIAHTVLGDQAEEYLDRYARFHLTRGLAGNYGVAFIFAKRPRKPGAEPAQVSIVRSRPVGWRCATRGAAQELMHRAVISGGEDNVSAVVVDIGGR